MPERTLIETKRALLISIVYHQYLVKRYKRYSLFINSVVGLLGFFVVGFMINDAYRALTWERHVYAMGGWTLLVIGIPMILVGYILILINFAAVKDRLERHQKRRNKYMEQFRAFSCSLRIRDIGGAKECSRHFYSDLEFEEECFPRNLKLVKDVETILDYDKKKRKEAICGKKIW